MFQYQDFNWSEFKKARDIYHLRASLEKTLRMGVDPSLSVRESFFSRVRRMNDRRLA